MWIKIIVLVAGIFSENLGSPNFGIFSQVSEVWNSNLECKKDIEKMADGLKRNETWPLRILDASTKIPSGILTGHFMDYGNFDECLDSGGPFDTKHCLATIFLSENSVNGIIGVETSQTSSLILRGSYCIPASCPTTALQNTLQELWQVKNISITQSDCHSKNSKVITAEDYVGMSIWGIFFSLAFFSTIYDAVVDKTKAKRNDWLTSFSLYTNGKNLLKTEVSSETMLFVHGLRFLSACWIVLGHRFFFTFTSSLLNLTDLIKTPSRIFECLLCIPGFLLQEMEKIRSQFFIQGILAVDTFFLLSGLFNCYHCLKVLETHKRFPVFTYYIHRYLRLTPVLAAIVLMYATWYPLIGDGPVWDETTSVWKKLCVENWWSTLLYINNYYNPVSQCAGQSWYLAVDMQLYWLSPLIIIPLWKRPRSGKLLLGILLFLSTVSQFVIAFVYKFRMPLIIDLSSSDEYEKVTKYLYVPTHTRATPYIIGVMIGHYLFNLKKTNTSLIMSRGFLFVGWLLSTFVALSVMFGNFQFSRPVVDHPYNPWESSTYISLHRIGWGAVLGWIIIICYSKQGGVVNSILSWKAFIPLGRVTYCIFLSHMAVQQYHIGTARTSDYFQYFNQIHRFFGDLIFSVLIATALSLVFESPIIVLEKLARRKVEDRDLKGEVNRAFQEDSNTVKKA